MKRQLLLILFLNGLCSLACAMDQSSLLGRSGGGFNKRQPVKLQSGRNSLVDTTDSQIDQSVNAQDTQAVSAPSSPTPTPKVASKPLPVPPSKNVSPRTSTSEDAARVSQFAVVTGSPMMQNNKRHALKLERIPQFSDTDTDSPSSPSGNDSSISPERVEGSLVESHSPKKWMSAKKSNSPLPSPTVSPRIGASSSRISQQTLSVSPRTSGASDSNGNSNNSLIDDVTMTPPLGRTRHALESLEVSRPALQMSKQSIVRSAMSKDQMFQLAIKQGNLKKATDLLKDGANINSLDSQSKSMLDFAHETRNKGLEQFLLAQGATPKDTAGTLANTVIDIIKSVSPERPKLTAKPTANGYYDPGLDESSDSTAHSPLHSPKEDMSRAHVAELNREFHSILAKTDIYTNDFKRLEILIAEGAQVNSFNASNEPALVALMQKQHPSEEAIKFLISHGADVNKQGIRSAANGKGMVFGPTVLQEAARKGLLRIVVLLLNHNANPNIADGNGSTPLTAGVYAFAAGRAEDVSVSIARELLKKGADIFHKSYNGKTAYEMASSMHNKKALADFLYRKQEEIKANALLHSVVDSAIEGVQEEN